MELDIRHSSVFTRNLEAYCNPDVKIIVDQGGARSTKTYSILQIIIYLCLNELHNEVIDIVRKTLAALRGTAMRDFFDILNDLQLYDETCHNKTDNNYSIKGNLIQFIGLDQPQKKRGAKRKILYCNEANELTAEDWKQLILRTTGKAFLDYNPSEEYSWIYDKVLTRKDHEFIKSTYPDNPFLEQTVIDEIERLKDEDENDWNVYGLGERGTARETIYRKWEQFKNYPEKIDETIYGLDFGFNNPTSLTQIDFADTVPYITEKIYQTGLTNNQVVSKLEQLGVKKSDVIYCDNAEPARIAEICEAGYNAKPADKSVKDGIDHCQSQKLMIHESSVNILKEIKSYKWKVNKNGITLDEPVKFMDHSMDSMRYGLYTHFLLNKVATLARFG